MRRAAAFLLLELGSCAGPSALDEAFGPSGQTLREWIEAGPAEQREAFALTERRCSRCHTLNVPFSSRFSRGTWSLQVRKMARKPGAGIPDEEIERIAAFFEHIEEERRRHPAPVGP